MIQTSVSHARRSRPFIIDARPTTSNSLKKYLYSINSPPLPQHPDRSYVNRQSTEYPLEMETTVSTERDLHLVTKIVA